MKKKSLVVLALAPLSMTSCIFNIKLKEANTVTYKNYNGDVLFTEKVERGKDTVYQGDIPSKPVQGAAKANIFTGWDKSQSNIVNDTVLTAQYKELTEIIDKDGDGMLKGVDPSDDPEIDPDSNYFEVGAKSFVYLDQNIRINFNKFLEENANMTYNNEIAKLGLFMSNPKIDFKDGLFSEKAYGGRENALYARLGCDEFKHFDFKDEAAQTYTYDKFDTTSGVLAHKYLFNESGEAVKDLIIIAFEGTNGKNRWASNFDVGYDNDDYYNKTGGRDAHPEWDENHKNYHKGFYVAASRVLNNTVDGGTKEGPVKLINYIESHSTKSNGKPIVFVTGHSRGGAMADIVGEYLENSYRDENGESKCIPFTYSFAAPATWGGNSLKPNTSTIFNIINSDDLVTKVPFSEWGFTRLGNDIIFESVNDKYKDLYNQNRDKRLYQRVENGDSILHNVGCKGREEIYNLNLTENPDRYMSNIALNTEYYTERSAAEAEATRLEAEYRSELGDFANFINFKIVERETLLNTYYDIYANNCLGTLTSLVGHLMTNDQKVVKNILDVIPLVSNSKFLELLAEVGVNIAAGGTDTVGLPHDYGSYHIILREYKGS